MRGSARSILTGLAVLATLPVLASEPGSSAGSPPVDPERAFEHRKLEPLRSWLDSLSQSQRDSVEALRARAWIARRDGNVDRAVRLIDQAVERAPGRADLRLDRASFRSDAIDDAGPFKSLRIAREVRRDLERAFEAAPDDVEALNALISFHRRAPSIVGGRGERADALMDRLRTVSRPHHRASVARLRAADGDYEAAIDSMQQAVAAVDDVPPEWHLRLGRWLEGSGRTGSAFDAWLQALAVAPDYAPALYEVGRLAAETGEQPLLGVDALRRMLEQPAWPGDPDPARAWSHLGELYRRLGRPEAARAAFERALELDPGLDDAREALRSLG